MTLNEYCACICRNLKSAVAVPLVAVSLQEGEPQIAKCHENVTMWVLEHPGHIAVRGWVTTGTDGRSITMLTPHSVVLGQDGKLFDITPIANEELRKTMWFVPHVGNESEYFRDKDQFQPFMFCDASLE